MPYDHSKNAGNRGDVWKHFALLTVVDRLPSGEVLRYIDTHAGAPQYELVPGAEWEQGIGRVLEKRGAFRGHCYVETAARWVAQARYPSSWRLVVDCAAARFRRIDLHLSDTARAVAADYEDLPALGLPQNVTVDFAATDGFARVEVIDGADLVLVDPPFSPHADADWRRLREVCVFLMAKGARFLAWYPIFSEIEPADLVAATGLSAFEVLWAPTTLGGHQELAGCGILASRECGDMLAVNTAQLERLASGLGGKFRRWAHGL
jgi:23S rRNA A2030 N6-methylase RlmJ